MIDLFGATTSPSPADEPALVAEMAKAVVRYHHPESPCGEWRKLVERVRAVGEALADLDINDLPSE